MKKKVNTLFIMNILFYLFIFIHKAYVNDNIAQVCFYIALCFSSGVLEEELRRKDYKVVIYCLIDFVIRIITIIFHFIQLTVNVDYINFITILFLLINILLESIIYFKLKGEFFIETDSVSHVEIDNFIKKYKQNELVYTLFDKNQKNEMSKTIKNLEISGKSNILIIALFFMLYITRFILNNFTQFLIIPISIIAILIFSNFKIFSSVGLHNIKRRRIDGIMFIIGYAILFMSEVVFYNYLGRYGVSLNLVGILFFVPLFDTKYMLKISIKKLYLTYINKANGVDMDME